VAGFSEGGSDYSHSQTLRWVTTHRAFQWHPSTMDPCKEGRCYTNGKTENACGIFAAASGQAATDTVWAQSLRAEQAVGHNHVAAAALFDLKSFFDTLQHDHLATRARIKKFPRKLARLGIDAYKAPRYVRAWGCVAAPLFPSRGVVAGCGFATTFVEIACIDVFTRFSTPTQRAL